MAKTLFFYDLETSGLDPRESRIMQFAGIRTDMKFEPIGEPINLLVRMTDDILPSPEAIIVTGITPQMTVSEGYSESELCRILMNDIFTPDTTVIGFNNIRFDDEFIRHLFWRNFYDPYEWSWKDGRSRWDMLDVVRMTRALRPDGIKWPVDDNGNATNKLELITSINNIGHYKAHDALSDVEALLSVTKLIKEKQPQIFEYLFKMRDKNEVKKLVNLENKSPFVYVSGRYDTVHSKATVAFPLTAGKNNNVVVYDLRYDPTALVNMSQKELAKKLYASWDERQADDFVKLPVKELHYNRAPAVAPISVLSQSDGWKRISISEEIINKHKELLLYNPSFAENIRSLFEKYEDRNKSPDPESQLYNSFLSDIDKIRTEVVRNASEHELVDLHPEFVDERLPKLLLHYKARNFPKSLSLDESEAWEIWRSEKIKANLPTFVDSLKKLSNITTDEAKLFVLNELHLWAESIIPME